MLILVANSAIGIFQEVRAKRTLDQLAVLNAPAARVVRDGDVAGGRRRGGRARRPARAAHRRPDPVRRRGARAPTGSRSTSRCSPARATRSTRSRATRCCRAASWSRARAGSRRRKVGADSYAAKLADRGPPLPAHPLRADGRHQHDPALHHLGADPGVARSCSGASCATTTLDTALRSTVAGVVAMVPEGLVLLTSIAFMVAAVTLARRQVLVQELPAVEGLARVDVVCLDKTGTLTEGEIVFDELEAARRWRRRACGRRRSARSPTTRTATPPRSRWPTHFDVAGLDAHRRGAVLVGPQVERGHVRRPRDRGSWARRRWCSPTTRRRCAPAPTSWRPSGRRVLVLAHSDAALAGETLPADLAPVALVMFAEKMRPDAAETLAYFAEQGVELKVISGDNPRTVGAVAARVGLDDADGGYDARELPDDLDEHGRGARAAPGVRPGHAAAEAGDGRRAAVEGPRGRDDRRRRERRAGAEGRRHRGRHGFGRGRDPRRRAARAARRQVRDAARRRRRGPAGDRQHRAVGEPVRHQDRLRDAARDRGGDRQLAVPVPAAPPHDRQRRSPSASPASSSPWRRTRRRYIPGFIVRVLRFSIPAGIVAGAAALVAYGIARYGHDLPTREVRTTSALVLIAVALWVLVLQARRSTGGRRCWSRRWSARSR